MNALAEIIPPPAALFTPANGLLRVTSEKFGGSRVSGQPSEDAATILEHEGTLLALVADGLGSAREGGAAAARLVDAVQQSFPARPRSWTAGHALEEIVRHLNRRFWQEGMARFESPERATTIAAVALEGDRLFALNAGDSRIYLWRDGELRQLSTDHRERHPQRRHVLTNAMGLAEELQSAKIEIPLRADDVVLLCSDGVTDVLADADLARLLGAGAHAATIVTEALRRATEETRDDTTALTLRVLETGIPRGVRDTARRVPATLKAGDVVDSFTLRQSFRASDRIWLAMRQGHPFVLKFAAREAATEDAALAAFQREVWHATQLQSEFFPAAFVPENATARYYAQEYIQAPTLRQFLAEPGPLAPAQAVELGRYLLRAEQFLVGHDFVHGDLKPENILVVREADALRFKLIDLGSVAEVFSLQGRAGTPSYLAPERFNGAAICERTEVFAVGVILYEALTGRLPYGEVEPFQKPVFVTPRPAAAFNSLVPPWLETILARALTADAGQRYQNYSEMLFELENPAKVRPFFRPGALLLERDPLRFYKTGFFIMAALALALGLMLLKLVLK